VSNPQTFLDAVVMEREDSVRTRRAKVAAHAVAFVVILVLTSALSIWLGLGPVLLSP